MFLPNPKNNRAIFCKEQNISHNHPTFDLQWIDWIGLRKMLEEIMVFSR